MKKNKHNQKIPLNSQKLLQLCCLFFILVPGIRESYGQCPPKVTGFITVNFVGPCPDAVTFISTSSNSPVLANGNLNLSANCAVAVSYSWTGPNGFTSTVQNPVRSNMTSADAGQYSVDVDYGSGCTGNAKINVNVLVDPATTMVQNVFVSPGPPVCFNATQTIVVAGSGTMFMIQQGGNVNMVAGHNIIFLPTTMAFFQSYLHAYITSTSQYCGMSKEQAMVTTGTTKEDIPLTFSGSFFKVYPNPSTGRFTLELTGVAQSQAVSVEVYGMRGEKILSEVITGTRKHEFSLSEQPAGIYVIKAVAGESQETFKLIKTR